MSVFLPSLRSLSLVTCMYVVQGVCMSASGIRGTYRCAQRLWIGARAVLPGCGDGPRLSPVSIADGGAGPRPATLSERAADARTPRRACVLTSDEADAPEAEGRSGGTGRYIAPRATPSGHGFRGDI